ncbi:hypothetical protein PACTADRAFT_49103 [Pachysolen tannophilus NRRL Y-2460]|uniref:DNA polymerase epsilon catalytic subunit n=1 Tax=Pachysolen tannophilus NRRL Y-2460 TaxID=669874 RepID=A0A1E4U065_PACTA|nr:hypothetical protein PACTADRAFT_49103 [Pachysolen tannophilus NRRL Y-2460]
MALGSKSKYGGSSTARFVKNNKGSYKGNAYSAPNDAQAFRSRLDAVKEIDSIDSMFGFDRYGEGPKKIGWLINMHPTTIASDEYLSGYSGVDYYFLDEEGGSFKTTIQFDPYFLIVCKTGLEAEVEEVLKKNLEGSLKNVSRLKKEDLSLPNHLIGLKRTVLKLSFHNVNDLIDARRIILPIVTQNKTTKDSKDVFSEVNFNFTKNNNEEDEFDDNFTITEKVNTKPIDALECIEDIREYDVPYHVRVSIDKDLRVGKWYQVEASESEVQLTELTEKLAFADPVVLAFDIETTKSPLKFPDSSVDQIMMISYMIDGTGFLITNRSIISSDIQDFEYTPKPEYHGDFTIFNEEDEKALIERFFEHIRDVRPTVIVTFNGDFFDWPFVETRAFYHGIDMFKEIGFAKDSEEEYKSSYCVHMDCFRWVKRDSYLPQGSQGLKAVTKVKLGYNPIELDPELMTPYAYENPQLLSEYSVSDAVATYYLYYKYVHPFIFSLCTIIPLNPDEVLRKGTGTLCEMLLMVQAFQKNIIFPNKHSDPLERFYNGHFLESETYVGGHVESLEAGVFRSDLPNEFNIDTTAIDEILGDLDNALKFAITVEGKKSLDDITNYEEIYNEIKDTLLELKNNPKRNEVPLIYHVDVASMYPNIMTSNRLQPDSMKSEEDCSACDFNRPGKTCARVLPWLWRGEFYPADYKDYAMIKRSLENEDDFNNAGYGTKVAKIKKRLEDYSKKVYHRIKQTETIQRDTIICQRENPFYTNTVSSFRDRRYHFKTLAKVWKGKLSKIEASKKHERDEANKLIVLYDSLQLAHKVILNSFYGYVMRKGSRWYSMEMAGVTCLTGATIIQMARALVERLGRPLELDTDGIWCILPSSFPEDFNFKMKNGKSLLVSYPCSMLNYLVHEKFTNHQYQELIDSEKLSYKTHSENTIFFEVDGPYKAMVLPTSKEEGKGLKKRYAVFNEDGSIAELKGFELKRRGELQLIKNFQEDIFKLFLEGNTLEECYAAVSNVANRWLDVLDTKGANLEDEDLIELICENRSMSKKLEEYGSQKSTSITTAKRLGEFLGEEMVKDKGLACKYIISAQPLNAPITERAIPVTIFSSDLSTKRHFLRRWLVNASLEDFDPRTIIDWGYYRERLISVVQKIITIPAALQNIKNPVPRVPHPEWLKRKIAASEDNLKQSNITNFFAKSATPKEVLAKQIKDIEDFGNEESSKPKVSKVISRKRKIKQQLEQEKKDAAIVLSRSCPSPEDDYVGFLIYQKTKWNQIAKQQETRKKLFGPNTGSAGTIGDIFKQRAENFANSNWEILEFKENTAVAGDIKAYVLIDGKVQSFTFHIPKKVYLNFREEMKAKDLNRLIKNCNFEKVSSILPNGNTSKNLFKLTMNEYKFTEECNKPGSIFRDESVEGIYESHIGSVERAIIELGNSVRFQESRIGALGKAIEKGFDQKSLAPIESEKYLQKFSMGIIYLLHIVANQYEFFALFKTWDSVVNIFVLKPSNVAQELPSESKLESLYKEIFNRKAEQVSKNYNIIDYNSDLEFEKTYFNDISKLYKKLNNVCTKLHNEKSSKSLFVLQSPYSNKVAKIVKPLAEFPTIQMKVNEITVPAIGWQQLVVKRIFNHYLSLAGWIKHFMALSRYSNIPLCNLNVQDTSYIIDVEYARRLKKFDIVLWWSPNPQPDLGGMQKDCVAPNVEASLEFPNINRSEVYESVSLELDLRNLSINSLLASALINEAEGTDLAEQELSFGETDVSTFAEDAFSAPALVVLRTMVKEWWDDAIKNNRNADSMVHNFVSWVQKPNSYLYDPALQYHVHNLTKKAFLQLLGEFKKMGSSVVFANRNKIILNISKGSVENSYAYGQYICKAVRAKPLFNYLDLEVTRYWDLLVWVDQYNFCGRGCTEIGTTETQQLESFSHWQIKNYLPIVLQPEFEDWVLIFLDALVKNKDNAMANAASGTPRITQINFLLKERKKIDDSSPSSGGAEDIAITDICEVFRKPLHKRIQQLIHRQNEAVLDPDNSNDYIFPKLPGSHLRLVNPTLELVKSLMHVFSSSKKRNIEIRMLRKELLKLFDVREFSEESIFHNPSTSLKLPYILCEYCNTIKDIDLCRDDEDSIFKCDKCLTAFNKVTIEEKAILEFKKLITTFFMQDLKCEKCNVIKSDSMSEFCSCSGNWVETLNKKTIMKKIKVFENISNYYDFKLLRDVMEEGL